MLNILLVDDEFLVRAGLKSMIHWENYDMTISAEANSVDNAISVLTVSNEIDIVLTDVVMPDKNGIELVRWIQLHCPHIVVALMSYHQDFRYVQMAMRMGVSDYIVKSEFSPETCSEILFRIRSAVLSRRTTISQSQQFSPQDYQNGSIIAWIDPAGKYIDDINVGCNAIYRISESILLVFYDHVLNEAELRVLENNPTDCILLLFEESNKMSTNELVLSVQRYMLNDFYYLCLPGINLYRLPGLQNKSRSASEDLALYQEMESKFCSISIFENEQRFSNLVEQLASCRFTPSIVYNILFTSYTHWKRILHDTSELITFPTVPPTYWYQWSKWLFQLRETLLIQSNFNNCTTDLFRIVNLASKWMREHFTSDIGLIEAAKYCNVSAGYLGRSFKRITGHTYSEFQRDLRLDYAKRLLINTNLPIYRVAELSGFQDPFYFTKVFKKATSLSPKEFRTMSDEQSLLSYSSDTEYHNL